MTTSIIKQFLFVVLSVKSSLVYVKIMKKRCHNDMLVINKKHMTYNAKKNIKIVFKGIIPMTCQLTYYCITDEFIK